MLNQDSTPLYDAVKRHIDDNVIAFHVPGHKYGKGIPSLADYLGTAALGMDLNGMDDLDYYHNPQDVLQEAQELFAQAFRAKHAFFLVNGTSGGIHTMIMSVCQPSDKMIVPRNVHKSVINGMILGGIEPIYVQPELDAQLGLANGVSTKRMKEVIKQHPEAKAVFLVNPTYYGVASDLKSIIELAHQADMYVLVDEAHGTHMYFHEEFPATAMALGADMSSISVHKTGGSLTQSSALLIGGNKVEPEMVRQTLNLLSTSSASYLLMCSLDVARKQLALKGHDIFKEILSLARWTRARINEIDGLYSFGREIIGRCGCYDFDETKLVIHVKALGYTGYEVEKILRKEYNIQIELADPYNIMAIISLGDTLNELQILVDSLKKIAAKPAKNKGKREFILPGYSYSIVKPRDAYYMRKKMVNLIDSEGYLAGETIMAYPPGVPIICAGEIITNEIIEYLSFLRMEECHLQGFTDPSFRYIKILDTIRSDLQRFNLS